MLARFEKKEAPEAEVNADEKPEVPKTPAKRGRKPAAKKAAK